MEIKDLSWNEVTSKRFNHPLLPVSIMMSCAIKIML